MANQNENKARQRVKFIRKKRGNKVGKKLLKKSGKKGIEVVRKIRKNCSICGKVFVKTNNLTRHLREQHSEFKVKLQCPLCPYLSQWI